MTVAYQKRPLRPSSWYMQITPVTGLDGYTTGPPANSAMSRVPIATKHASFECTKKKRDMKYGEGSFLLTPHLSHHCSRLRVDTPTLLTEHPERVADDSPSTVRDSQNRRLSRLQIAGCRKRGNVKFKSIRTSHKRKHAPTRNERETKFKVSSVPGMCCQDSKGN